MRKDFQYFVARKKCKLDLVFSPFIKVFDLIHGRPMSLTLKDVTQIARLARIQLDERRLVQAQTELNEIFDLIAQLQSVDTKGIEPMAHPLSALTEVSLRLRQDEITENGTPARREDLMQNAPARHDGLFLVPKVIE